MDCFNNTGVNNPKPVDGYLSQAGIVKKGKGKAEWSFWFLGYPQTGPDGTGDDRILYEVHLVSAPGNDAFNGDWPPKTTTLACKLHQ